MATNRYFQEGFAATPGTLARSTPILTDFKGTQNGFDVVMAEINALQGRGPTAAWAGSAADIPTSYVGAALKLLRVNAAASGIEFIAPGSLTVKTISATTYTLVASDAGCLLIFTAATAVTVTVPTFATIPFDLSACVILLQYGLGGVTAAGAGGVAVNSSGGLLTTRGQFAQVALTQPYQDAWLMIGDRLSAAAGSGTVTNTGGALTANAVVLGAGANDTKALASLGTAAQVLTSNGPGVPPSFQAAAAGGGTGTVTHTAGALTLNALVIGNGAADEAVLASLGTTVTVLHGNAAGPPTFGAVALATDVAGLLPVANGGTGTATSAANLVLAGPTTGVAAAPTFRAPVIADLPFAGVASGVATLDGSGKVPAAQLPASVTGAMTYQGTWNASTNTPTFASGVGTKGFFYKVATAGTTTIDGISQWNVGDSIVFDGTTWDKIDGISNEVVSVAALVGAITAAALKTALAISVATDVSGILPVANGGTGTATPSLVAGTNVTLSGSWPNQTIAAAAGGGTGVYGPNAFSAYRSSTAQSVSSGVWTKVGFNSKNFDTAAAFDSATNFRFTPTVAGYYALQAGVQMLASSNAGGTCSIYKNNVSFAQSTYGAAVVTAIQCQVSAVVYLNGTTDYVELFGNVTGGTPTFSAGADLTYFSGALIGSTSSGVPMSSYTGDGSGNLTTTSATFVSLGSYTASIQASIGDIIEMELTGSYVGGASGTPYVDFGFNVNGTLLANFSEISAVGNTSAPVGPVCLRVLRTVVAGDLSAGRVTVTPVWRTSTSTATFINGASVGALTLKNFGDGSGVPARASRGVLALTDAATITIDARSFDNFRVTLAGNRTLANPVNLTDGQVLNMRVIQDATGSRTLAYGTKYKFAGGTVPVLSTAINAKDSLSCEYDATDDTLFCAINKAFA